MEHLFPAFKSIWRLGENRSLKYEPIKFKEMMDVHEILHIQNKDTIYVWKPIYEIAPEDGLTGFTINFRLVQITD